MAERMVAWSLVDAHERGDGFPSNLSSPTDKGALFFVPPGTPPSLRLFNPSQTPLYVCLPDFGGQPPAQSLHF